MERVAENPNHCIMIRYSDGSLHHAPDHKGKQAGNGEAGVADAPRPGAAVGTYRLSYLDEDVLVGRANELGGVFIFTRAS